MTSDSEEVVGDHQCQKGEDEYDSDGDESHGIALGMSRLHRDPQPGNDDQTSD